MTWHEQAYNYFTKKAWNFNWKKPGYPTIKKIVTTNQPWRVSGNGTVVELHTIGDQPKIATVLRTKAKAKADKSNPKSKQTKKKPRN